MAKRGPWAVVRAEGRLRVEHAARCGVHRHRACTCDPIRNVQHVPRKKKQRRAR